MDPLESEQTDQFLLMLLAFDIEKVMKKILKFVIERKCHFYQ
jgi:hypothetical protein